MFSINRELIKEAAKDRALVILTLVGVVLALFIIVSGLLNIRPSDIQVPVRYSAYGVTNLYREKWYYLLSFIVAGLLFLVIHPLISLKLFQEKGRDFAVAFSAITVILCFIGILITLAVFRVVSISL